MTPPRDDCVAVLLCAGRGTRLGDLTIDRPKALLDVGGEPIAARALRLLRRHGFRRVIINVHHCAEQIHDALGDGSRYDVALEYLDEEELTGTAGPLVRLRSELASVRDVLVIYGDLVLDDDLSAMLDFHRSADADVTLMVHQRNMSNSLLVLDESRRVVRFLERPTPEERESISSAWVNSGVQLLRREALEHLPDSTPCDLPADLYVPHVNELRIMAYPLTGLRVAVDSAERLQLARETFAPTD